jgi:hypothetical protein
MLLQLECVSPHGTSVEDGIDRGGQSLAYPRQYLGPGPDGWRGSVCKAPYVRWRMALQPGGEKSGVAAEGMTEIRSVLTAGEQVVMVGPITLRDEEQV